MIRVMEGDCRSVLATLPAQSVQCCVTSPPYYGLRQYLPDGHPDMDKQIGLEKTPDEYVAEMVAVFREVRRVLRDDGVLWLNLGDSYNAAGRTGHGTRIGYKQGTNRASASGGDACRPSVASLKEKDLIGIPWMVAFALRADGWYLRSEVIWAKPNPMPESVTDRPTKAHEQVFLLSKSARYFFDADAIREENSNPDLTECITHWKDRAGNGEWESGTGGRMGSVKNGRNVRTIWTIATQPFSGTTKTGTSHFATMPPDLAERCIKAGTSERGCCAECGAPWVRVVETTRDERAFARDQRDGQSSGSSHRTINGVVPSFIPPKSTTTGWAPSCDCPPHDPIPCTILDPFGGAGTTALVADRLGRNATIIELNPEYAALARERVTADAGMFAHVA